MLISVLVHSSWMQGFTFFKSKEAETPVPPVSSKRLRFYQFASMFYEQEPYMTPRDFLYSVLLEKMDRKLYTQTLPLVCTRTNACNWTHAF